MEISTLDINKVEYNQPIESNEKNETNQIDNEYLAVLHTLNEINGLLPYINKNYLLPEDFSVYTKGDVVVNHPCFGFEEKTLPVFNHYLGEDGGYVAIYTHDAENSVYSVGGDIYVAGMVRVQGQYYGNKFVPEGYLYHDNITQDADILAICDQYLPHMQGKMWIGGDTGGFL